MRSPVISKDVRAVAVPVIRSQLIGLATLLLLALGPSLATAQARLEREGVVMYWGLVPAAIVSQQHSLEEMHGVVPKDGGQNHHLVVALFYKRDGSRVADAVVRAQLSEIGIVDAPPKYLTPMSIDGQASYGQVFWTAKEGPYRFRVFVKPSDRATEIEFAISAWSPHRETR